MHPAEESYLAKFRTLASTKASIVAMTAELRGICESLSDWQKTAYDLASLGGSASRPEWSDDRLKGLVTLRSRLIDYQRQAEELRAAWEALTPEQRLGFAAP
jgi:hypothetical protein